MRMRRLLGIAALAVGLAVSVASPVQAAIGPWAVVSLGAHHTCAISAAKSLYCWGQNGSGQVGDGTTDPRPSPKRIGASGIWTSVSAGFAHTCAVTTGKSLYCWGYNAYGQVGNGTTANPQPSPKRIGASGVWAAASAGGLHTCATTTGKSLYCWGYNVFGQVGDGTGTSPRLTPRKVGASGVWAGVTAGAAFTCAITIGKSLYCWGSDDQGQLGDGPGVGPQLLPKRIGSAGVWAQAEAGDFHACGISTGKSLYCWGYNGRGQLGDGTTNLRSAPTRIGGGGVWARVSAGGGTGGFSHTCATTTGSSLYCWGYNAYGQIGDGTTTQWPTPKKVGTSGVWAQPSAGGSHTCATTTGKSLYCWGYNLFGQVGDGTTTQRVSPKKIP